MSTATTTQQIVFHVSLSVSDMERSVTFYRTLLNCEPVKQRHDYAKFELAKPPLVLSLEVGRPTVGGYLSHLGIRLLDAVILVGAQRRLELAGFRTLREEGVECCYAKQTKFWVRDPDGVTWELYVMEGDVEHHGEGIVPLPVVSEQSCCQETRTPIEQEPVLLFLDEVRQKTLRVLDGVSEEHARWTPPHLQNSILWHAGHAYCVLECLAGDALDLPKQMPQDWFKMFSWESEPAKVAPTQWPRLADVRERLVEQYHRMRNVLARLPKEQLSTVVADGRTARYFVLHALADEAAHHGEIWLLRKMLASGKESRARC